MKNRMRPIFLTVAICLMSVTVPATIGAQDSAFERIGNNGIVDWIDQRVSASGIGVARKDAGPGQARALAERAALTVARRNLLEVVRGVHIDSQTTVENLMVTDDSIVARVSGEVKYARVDRVEHLSDGTVQTTVSMPLTGKIGAIVFRAATGASPDGSLQRRLEQLERRVRQLEDRIAGLERTSLEQKEIIDAFRRFTEAWVAALEARTQAVAFDQVDVQRLARRLDSQEKQLAQMASRLDGLAARFDRMAADDAAPPPAAPSKPPTLFTGLVVDARGTGFRPCLKPEIYVDNQRLYPRSTVDLQTAVRTGYVRYYRQLEQAQQSDRVGPLPLTVRASGTHGGERGLKLETELLEQIKAAVEHPEGFLRDCRVVIVF